MAYYVRILASGNAVPSLTALDEQVRAKGFSVSLSLDVGNQTEWKQITASHTVGNPITCIERDVVSASRTAKREITELIKEAKTGLPKASREWVVGFLATVKTVFAFQVLRGTEEQNGWTVFDELLALISESNQSIIHADREGFSNEFGDDVLWLCSKPFGETRRAAVRSEVGWARFNLNLQNKKDCAAFRRGELPNGVEPIS